jgi:acyl-coenzyme A thioesterase PaaI-like protein
LSEAPGDARVTHHELCFGCGVANLFGLQMELEPAGEGRVEGRCFLKQDHQGPPGVAHGGIVAAALDEAMSLAVHAAGIFALTTHLELDLRAAAPVGAFLAVEGRIDRREGRRIEASASARAVGEEEPLATATAVFVEAEAPGNG